MTQAGDKRCYRQSSTSVHSKVRHECGDRGQAIALQTRAHLSRQYVWAFGSGIANSAENARVLETSGSKFAEEGISFLCSRDSRKPVRIGLPDIGRKGVCKDQFGGIG